MTNEKIIYAIYEDLIQSASEANLGRELNSKELKRLPSLLADNEEFVDAVYSALVNAVEEMDEQSDWKEYDKLIK